MAELDRQFLLYKEFKKKRDTISKLSFDQVKDYFKDRNVECMKLNYSLDAQSQDFAGYSAYFKISCKDDTFELFNRKPLPLDQKVVDKMVNDDQIFKTVNTDPDCTRYKDRVLQNEHYFKTVKSFVSCKISDIKGFIFGGMSSRFWMLRKFIIGKIDLNDKIIIKSWKCLTLQLEHRDIDIIIHEDRDMKMFLKFLLFALRSVNGVRDSGLKLLNLLV